MKTRRYFQMVLVLSLPLGWSALAQEKSAEPLQIGSRLELFVDDGLIDRMDGARLKLHNPVDVGKVMDFDRPWEGSENNYMLLFKDGDKVRMYYRAARWGGPKEKRFTHICYAESNDGIQWTKPSLGLCEFDDTKKNNITYVGPGAAAWYCFKDENPDEPDQRRYKAFFAHTVGPGGAKGMGVMVSADGLDWKPWPKAGKAIITGGPLDSLNTVRWDPDRKLYRALMRNWVTKSRGFIAPPDLDAPPSQYHSWYVNADRVRAIATSTSKDFLNWSKQKWLIYPPGTPMEHLYTNAFTPYFRAPHIYLAFPMRFVPEREVISGWTGTARGTKGASDAVFMSSRGGLHWERRFLEGFLRPGLDPKNWTDRNMIIAPGVVQTGAGQISLYYISHYKRDDIHVRRCSLRLDGFVSVNAGYAGGEFVTKPLLVFGPKKRNLVLVINYSTSAVGDIRVEIQKPDGTPINGYALQEANEIVGDQIEGIVSWKGGSDISSLAGKPVRLRFVMKDADLYSIRAKGEPSPRLLRLGARGPTEQSKVGEYFYEGDIAEIFVYGKVLSAGQLNEVGSYLEAKYGLDTAYQSDTVSKRPPQSGLEIWLRADAIKGVADGKGIRVWPNSVAGKVTAMAEQTDLRKQLKYHANMINSLPVVRGKRTRRADPQDGTFMELVGAGGDRVNLFDVCDPGMTIFAVLKPASRLGNVVLEDLKGTFTLNVGNDGCTLSAKGELARARGLDESGFRIVTATVSNMFLPASPDIRLFVDGEPRASRDVAAGL